MPFAFFPTLSLSLSQPRLPLQHPSPPWTPSFYMVCTYAVPSTRITLFCMFRMAGLPYPKIKEKTFYAWFFGLTLPSTSSFSDDSVVCLWLGFSSFCHYHVSVGMHIWSTPEPGTVSSRELFDSLKEWWTERSLSFSKPLTVSRNQAHTAPQAPHMTRIHSSKSHGDMALHY